MISLEKQYFVTELLAWFNTYKRDLPWRKNKNPYYIWISEIMLQQTRVDTVIPYFERFIDKFPTLDDLAEAPEEDVLKCWEGLGYYSRARNLHAAVKEVQATYGSTVPDTQKEISTLKGVGPYTSGAILSIAYNRPEPAVDGNVMRVLSRYLLITEDITKIRTRTYMEDEIREMIPHDAAGDFNQALMELGALVCTPKSPQCLTCPVMQHCQGRLAGMEEALPVKKKAKPPRPVQRLTAFIAGTGENEGRFLIRKRPDSGLLARMWELPHFEFPLASFAGGTEEEMVASHGEWLQQRLLEEDGVTAEGWSWCLDVEHTFSHLQWKMKLYRCNGNAVSSMALPEEQYRWINFDEMEFYAFPNVFLKMLRHLRKPV